MNLASLQTTSFVSTETSSCPLLGGEEPQMVPPELAAQGAHLSRSLTRNDRAGVGLGEGVFGGFITFCFVMTGSEPTHFLNT